MSEGVRKYRDHQDGPGNWEPAFYCYQSQSLHAGFGSAQARDRSAIICAFWPVPCFVFDIFLVPFKHNGKVERAFWTQEGQSLCVRTLSEPREALLIICGTFSTNPHTLLISPGCFQETISIGTRNEALLPYSPAEGFVNIGFVWM